MLPTILGAFTEHPHVDDWVQSELVQVDALGGHRFRFVFEDPASVKDPGVARAIANSLKPGLNLLVAAEAHVFLYFQDTMRLLADDSPPLTIARAADVWRHVELGDSIHVHQDEGRVYLSLESECAWEREHGLQLVFRDGVELVKVGMFDGHLTNEHDDVYRSIF